MELKLVRKYCKDEYTIGQLFVIENGKAIWVADTLEDKVRDYNKDGDLLDEGEEKGTIEQEEKVESEGLFNYRKNIYSRFYN